MSMWASTILTGAGAQHTAAHVVPMYSCRSHLRNPSNVLQRLYFMAWTQ